nr:hypothetical protein [Nonomuraea aurantiaca]
MRSPIFGRDSFPPVAIVNRAFLVNRIACRLSRRERNRGGSYFAGSADGAPLSIVRQYIEQQNPLL